MKRYMVIAVIGLCACSVDAGPIEGSRMSSVKKGLFGAAGRGGAGAQIVELDIPDAGPGTASRPTRHAPDAGELPQDAGESPDAMALEPDAGAPDGSQPPLGTHDAGAPEDAGTPNAACAASVSCSSGTAVCTDASSCPGTCALSTADPHGVCSLACDANTACPQGQACLAVQPPSGAQCFKLCQPGGPSVCGPTFVCGHLAGGQNACIPQGWANKMIPLPPP